MLQLFRISFFIQNIKILLLRLAIRTSLLQAFVITKPLMLKRPTFTRQRPRVRRLTAQSKA